MLTVDSSLVIRMESKEFEEFLSSCAISTQIRRKMLSRGYGYGCGSGGRRGCSCGFDLRALETENGVNLSDSIHTSVQRKN